MFFSLFALVPSRSRVETWGARVMTGSHLPRGVECTGSTSCNRAQQPLETARRGHKAATLDVEGSASPPAGSELGANAQVKQNVPREQDQAEMLRCREEKGDWAELSTQANSSGERGKPHDEGRQAETMTVEARAVGVLSEAGTSPALSSLGVETGCRCDSRPQHPKQPSDPRHKEVPLLPRQDRLYWREGYARVYLKDVDGYWQRSRFDNIESLANGGCSSSRISVFRKRTEECASECVAEATATLVSSGPRMGTQRQSDAHGHVVCTESPRTDSVCTPRSRALAVKSVT